MRCLCEQHIDVGRVGLFRDANTRIALLARVFYCGDDPGVENPTGSLLVILTMIDKGEKQACRQQYKDGPGQDLAEVLARLVKQQGDAKQDRSEDQIYP